jgi:low affinity Fe/Cu permease
MKNIYWFTEIGFEKLTSIAISILGNSVTFIIAVCTLIFWLIDKQFYNQNIHDSIRDVIIGVTFLSLFIIQKSSNRTSASLHLKLNELVATHKNANNNVMNVDKKTEYEISELSKEYAELAERVKDVEVEKI